MLTLRGHLLAFVAGCSFISAPAYGDTIMGHPRVVDGDTLAFRGNDKTTYVRLTGIDAPELNQKCDEEPLGEQAKKYLQDLVEGRSVACEWSREDRYGRALGTCLVYGYLMNDVELNDAMVRSGYAFAYPLYSKKYVLLEQRAHERDLPVHEHQCEKPWRWRTEHGPQH